MHGPDNNATPPRSVIRRLITPWEYRHIHAVAGIRLSAGGFQLGVGSVLLSLGRKAEAASEKRTYFRWAAWFLGMGALQLLGGLLDMTVARSQSSTRNGIN
jgi:hypothetical protein